MATRITSLIPVGTWAVDPAHSSVQFAVKHMGIATVRGKFTEFEGTLGVGEDLASSNARGTVDGRVDHDRRGAARCAPAVTGLLQRRRVPGDRVRVDADRGDRRGVFARRRQSHDARHYPAR